MLLRYEKIISLIALTIAFFSLSARVKAQFPTIVNGKLTTISNIKITIKKDGSSVVETEITIANPEAIKFTCEEFVKQPVQPTPQTEMSVRKDNAGRCYRVSVSQIKDLKSLANSLGNSGSVTQLDNKIILTMDTMDGSSNGQIPGAKELFRIRGKFVVNMPAITDYKPNRGRIAKIGNSQQVTYTFDTDADVPLGQIQVTGEISKKIDCLVTPEELKAIVPSLSLAKAKEILGQLNEVMNQIGADTRARQWAFVSQAAVETAGFTSFIEKGSDSYFSKYEPGTSAGRILGNTQEGDGARFKGRGWLHLTGRDNYTRLNRFLRKKGLNVDLIANPDLVATDANIMAEAAAWDWRYNKKMNSKADTKDIEKITRAINGGTNGIKDRSRYYDKAQNILPPSPECP